jgi:transposase
LHESREALQQEVETLQLTIDKLWRQLYGHRRERVVEDPHQIHLAFGDDPQAADLFQDLVDESQRIVDEIRTRRKAKRRPQRREKFPEHLPRVEQVIDVPDADKHCPTHGPRTLMGYDETETLKMKRPELYVVVTKYPKYVCEQASECGVVQAERPTGLVEGNRFDTSLAAEIITAKYAYHLPFYRQQGRAGQKKGTGPFCRNGPKGASHKMDLSPFSALDPADPRSQRIHDVLREAQDKHEPSVKARMWAYRSVDLPINVFDFTVSRHRDGPDEILSGYTGKLMGDCWSGFQKIDLRSDGRITRGACWARAPTRRRWSGARCSTAAPVTRSRRACCWPRSASCTTSKTAASRSRPHRAGTCASASRCRS